MKSQVLMLISGGNLSGWLTYFPNGYTLLPRNFSRANCIEEYIINNEREMADKALQRNYRKLGEHKYLFIEWVSGQGQRRKQLHCSSCICPVAVGELFLAPLMSAGMMAFSLDLTYSFIHYNEPFFSSYIQ